MRRVVLAGASLLAITLAATACQKKTDAAATGDAAPATATASVPAALTSPPKRKPGLWSHQVSSAGVNQAMKVCLDADTDAKMTVWGQAASKEMCAKQAFAPAPGGFTFESECDLGSAGKTVSKGTITGDFNSAYTLKATSVTTGGSMPQANGSHEMTMAAKWEGPCPAGMKGGDAAIILPNGQQMTINMENMASMAGGGK